jgi:hypothetical protein
LNILTIRSIAGSLLITNYEIDPVKQHAICHIKNSNAHNSKGCSGVHTQCHNVGEKIGNMDALTTLLPQNFVH